MAPRSGPIAGGISTNRVEKDSRLRKKSYGNIKSMGERSPRLRSANASGAPLDQMGASTRHGSFFACSTYDKKKPDSCTFTKENRLRARSRQADVQETTKEEYSRSGRVMVGSAGGWAVHALTGYPDCKTNAPACGQEGSRYYRSIMKSARSATAIDPKAWGYGRVHFLQRLI